MLIHQYGNYFCQKLFPRLKSEHKFKFLEELRKNRPGEKKPDYPQIPKKYYDDPSSKELSNFLWIAMNAKGTHSLQVFIENLDSPEYKVLLSELIEKENPLFFTYNKHATHVLIKYIELTPEVPYLNNIYQTVTTNFT
jgi:hypothetical protein